MSKKCQITHKKANNAYSISHSHVKTKRLQNVNLQKTKIWSTVQSRWIKVVVSTKALKKRYEISI